MGPGVLEVEVVKGIAEEGVFQSERGLQIHTVLIIHPLIIIGGQPPDYQLEATDSLEVSGQEPNRPPQLLNS